MPEPFLIGGETVAPGEARRLMIPVARLYTQEMIHLPLTVLHGSRPGARLWISAAIHGDEINGTEIIRRVLDALDHRVDRGTLVTAPIVNLMGFLQQSRYLPDRRDLNRSFPGSARGSLASQLAHLFMKEVVDRCTHGIDLHTGSHHRTNLPQIRGNLDDTEVLRLARAFRPPLIVHAGTRPGSLRAAASKRGIPMLMFESSEPLRFEETAIGVGVQGVLRVLRALKMTRVPAPGRRRRTIESRSTHWIRAPQGGVLHLTVGQGDVVSRRQVIGMVRNAFGDPACDLRSRTGGIVIGHTLNPLVNRGDAVVHVAEPLF